MRILQNYTVALLPSYKCCPLKGDRLLVTTWAIVPLVKHPSVTHVARHCGMPSSTDRSVKFCAGKESGLRDNWRRDSTDCYGKSTTTRHHNGNSHMLAKESRDGDQVQNRRINTINENKESHAGSYYTGNWVDDSSADSIRDGPGILPDGSFAALWRMVRSRRTRCLTRRLAQIGPVRRIVQRIRCWPNGSRDNCLTGKLRKGIRSHTRPSWVQAGARSYSSWSV